LRNEFNGSVVPVSDISAERKTPGIMNGTEPESDALHMTFVNDGYFYHLS
jgi:hypothetical protein